MTSRLRCALERLPLVVVVAISATLAVYLMRHGHAVGDDFALYLRQARSVFDGDMAQVVADNRYAVNNSTGVFSPVAYPWGFPLVLSPFVRFLGLDFDRLKYVVVACWCVWLVMFHGIVARRGGRVLALAFTLAIGTVPVYLLHQNEILSEFPYMVTVAIFIWWLDRVHQHHRFDVASTNRHVVDLMVAGALVAVSFNFRREAIALIFVIPVTQLVDVIAGRTRRHGEPRPGTDRFRLAMTAPYLGFAVSAVLAQLLLPAMLFPKSGDAPSFVVERLFRNYPASLSKQLGLGSNHLYGVLIMIVAVIGMVTGIARRPRLDAPLAAVTVGTALFVSTHIRMVDRYYFQVTPWLMYFAVGALVSTVRFVVERLDGDRARRGLAAAAATCVGLVPTGWLIGAHAADMPRRLSSAKDFRDTGQVLFGVSARQSQELFAMVEKVTPGDAVVAYYRARTMTLMTDRRSVQSASIGLITLQADFFAQRKNTDYYQPTEAAAEAAGYQQVWENEAFILWRVPDQSD